LNLGAPKTMTQHNDLVGTDMVPLLFASKQLYKHQNHGVFNNFQQDKEYIISKEKYQFQSQFPKSTQQKEVCSR
jgi:hypothetical protein